MIPVRLQPTRLAVGFGLEQAALSIALVEQLEFTPVSPNTNDFVHVTSWFPRFLP